MSQDEYYRDKLHYQLKEYIDKHKYTYNVLKTLSNMMETSDTLPIATIYGILSNAETEKAQVLRQINDSMQHLMPKPEDTKGKSESNDASENTEPQKQEENKKEESKDTESKASPESEEKTNEHPQVSEKEKPRKQRLSDIDEEDFELEWWNENTKWKRKFIKRRCR